MPIIKFKGWDESGQGRGGGTPGTQGHGLVNYRIGSVNLNSGILRFDPGAKVALHFHNVEEQVTVIEGEAVCIIDGERHVLHPYDTTYVPAGTLHHFLNESEAPMAIHCTYGGAYVPTTVL